ncbi:MAG: glycosyltransferase [Gammaproteobacteria bacterium]|nr:MAG: glycosyltransferase [Gammaproteobacteria bacterium]
MTAVLPPGSPLEAMLEGRVPVLRVPMRGLWDLAARRRLRRLALSGGVPLVQTWMGRATRLLRLPSRRVVHVARLGGYYDVKGYRHAHAWIGNTRGICDHLLAAGLPASRVFHIGNFYRPPPPLTGEQRAVLRRGLGVPEGAWMIFALGRLHPNKGFDTLLEALSRLPETIAGRPWHMVIAGEGPLGTELREAGRRLGLEQRLTWPGWNPEPAPWYQVADLFVCPSRHEPLGNVILEAWGNRVPVLACASQGPSELIRPGRDGMLVPVDRPPALARAIADLLGEEALREGLVEAGFRRLEEEFSVEVILERYRDLYERLTGA